MHDRRTIRSLGVEAPGRSYFFDYEEGPPPPGQVRLDTLYSGFSAGTELTFLKESNPYLHSHWDAERGVFVSGEPSARYPVPFLGYMEVARVKDSGADDVAADAILCSTYGHKSGHTADPFHELLVPLPAGIDPVLGIFVAQMGPIAANGILHADAEAFGGGVRRLGEGVAGRPVVVIGGGSVGLLTALFAKNAGALVILAEPSGYRRRKAEELGLTAMTEEQAWQHAKARWQHGGSDRGADFVFQTRARSESLHFAMRALRPQGTVIDLAFYQGGADQTRFGEEFHHNGLALRCAQIGRVPRGLAHRWDRRSLATETIRLLQSDGDAIRNTMISHIVPIDEAPAFLGRLIIERADFVQIVFRLPAMNGSTSQPVRILFVFAWLVVGGEETEVRLLARTLDPRKFRLDVVACFQKPGMPEQTHRQLKALGIDVDCAPYDLSFEDTIAYLANKICAYDIVVSCQNVADIYPALERLHWRPPLIEHGGLVSEALAGPKHFTSRYVGVCRSIRDAAARRMPGGEDRAVEIPSMVDLEEFARPDRAMQRAALGVPDDAILVGWVGRLDAKKRVEDFIEAAAILHAKMPEVRFVVVGGPDAFMPDYAVGLRELAIARGLASTLTFLGDRDDVPALLVAMDIFVWLSRGEGMPHVIAEAGAAGLAVVATTDNGSMQQIEDGVSGVFVPHESPQDVALAVERLVRQPALRQHLGSELRRKVETTYSAAVVVPQWEALFQAVLAERPAVPRAFGLFELRPGRVRVFDA